MDDPAAGGAPRTPDDAPSSGEPGLGSRLVALLLVFAIIAGSLALAPTGDQMWLLLVGAPIALIVSRWRGGLGFSRPRRGFVRTFLLAAALGAIVQLVAVTAFDPLVERLTGDPIDLSAFTVLEGDALALTITLGIVWTLVAFGEEIVFRGLLVTELDRLLGTTRGARVVNLLFGSAVFGVAHLYQGISGILTTAAAGLLLAWLYLREERNLWLPILVHGWIDTVGLVMIYYGVYDDLALW